MLLLLLQFSIPFNKAFLLYLVRYILCYLLKNIVEKINQLFSPGFSLVLFS